MTDSKKAIIHINFPVVRELRNKFKEECVKADIPMVDAFSIFMENIEGFMPKIKEVFEK